VSRHSQRALVLLYHRVCDPTVDPLGLAVAPDRFADHLAALADDVDLVPLERVYERSPRGRSVAVTFDDGYADNVANAAPLLVDAGAPATFFVVASDPHVEFWWDRLDHLLEPAPAVDVLDITISGRRLRADVRTEAGRARARRALNHRARVLHPNGVEAVLAQVEAQLGTTATPCERHRRASHDELTRLAAMPGLSVGSHTCRHPMLGGLPLAEQERELADARGALRGIGLGEVATLAYPFGMPGSWDRRTEATARDVGYRIACTNVVGVVRRRTPRHRLPRCQVWDCTADELRRRVDGWFAGAR
jgi:peptidoglycan/xylan/chitin deacetylase (PgdA/CDA1 family)